MEFHHRGSVNRFRRRVDAIFEEFDRDFQGSHGQVRILHQLPINTARLTHGQAQAQAGDETGRMIALSPRDDRSTKSHSTSSTTSSTTTTQPSAAAISGGEKSDKSETKPSSSMSDDSQREIANFNFMSRSPFDLIMPSHYNDAALSTFALPMPRPRPRPSHLFRLDVSETSDAFVVHAEMAGVARDDVKVNVRQGTLTISAERRHETKEDDRTFHRQERVFGVIARSIQLPPSVDPDRVAAKFENGLLTVSMQKRQDAENGRDIPIAFNDQRAASAGTAIVSE
jgi:HSP20 family protein